MRRITLIFTFLSILTFVSCFTSYENEQIVGPYFLCALESPGDMSIIYNEKKDYSGGPYIVFSTVYEIQWNKNFILVKQHPDDVEFAIRENYRVRYFQTLQSENKENIHESADSLAKWAYLKEKKRGRLKNVLGKSKNDVTLYYIVDVKHQKYPILATTPKEFDSLKQVYNVGKMIGIKYFENLDK